MNIKRIKDREKGENDKVYEGRRQRDEREHVRQGKST